MLLATRQTVRNIHGTNFDNTDITHMYHQE